ncbi:MAG: tail fiber domain-containing protein [Magnetococcales bacterium]|nr:tail fiber domain-containing protein [Magnetococcales bacterium]
MTALPPITDYTTPSPNKQSKIKTYFTDVRAFMAGLLGTTGTVLTALQTLLGSFGTAGYVLTSTGTGTVPTFQAPASGGVTANSGDPYNTYAGHNALLTLTDGHHNTAFGYAAMDSITGGDYNCAFGYGALASHENGVDNAAFGYGALASNTTSGNTAFGYQSLLSNTTGAGNTACGWESLKNNTTYDNCTGLGREAAVTGSNQVQLGNSSTTTYSYGTVQDRASDARDKAEIRDTILGLSFIIALRPVDFKWNYREDYTEKLKDGTTITHPEGSKIRKRFHHGIIAQEVKEVMDTMGVDFGGYQDHKINGGEDRLTFGYSELIAPMIKAIQELNEKVERLSS